TGCPGPSWRCRCWRPGGRCGSSSRSGSSSSRGRRAESRPLRWSWKRHPLRPPPRAGERYRGGSARARRRPSLRGPGRARAYGPRVLRLDEPTASLDPGQRRRLWETVTALRDEGGWVVFAPQNLEELDLYADRVAVLQRGQLTFVGPIREYDELHAEEVFS